MSQSMSAGAKRRVSPPVTIEIAISGRYMGRRRLSWEDGLGRRYSVAIASRPEDADINDASRMTMQPPKGAERDAADWFETRYIEQGSKPWREVVGQVWRAAEEAGLFTAEHYAKVDGERTRHAETYARSETTFQFLRAIVDHVSLKGLSRSMSPELREHISQARSHCRAIEAAGADAEAATLKSLKRKK